MKAIFRIVEQSDGLDVWFTVDQKYLWFWCKPSSLFNGILVYELFDKQHVKFRSMDEVKEAFEKVLLRMKEKLQKTEKEKEIQKKSYRKVVEVVVLKV